ncbi:MAG TPA: 3'-5' exonuclease [Actinomycetota bacterium]|nr:3'-5' exonuclease [Actinomycetota bacterium]
MRRLGGVTLGGGVWDRRGSWRSVPFAAIDLETTGLDPERDAIVSFGVVPVDRGQARLDRAVSRVVDPGRPMSPDVVAIHGIRPRDLDGAAPLAHLRDDLRSALEGRVVVAWTSWVESAFLARALGGTARAWSRRIVDVRRLAILEDHLAGRNPSPAVSASLGATAERFGVPPDRAHHALWDAFVTAQLLLVVATRLERRGRGRLGALVAAGTGRVPLDPRRPPAPSVTPG